MATFFQKNGYDVEISIGSYLINTSNERLDYGLCDQLTISCATNQSRTAVFSFIPPEDTVELEQFQGEEVNIMIRTANGWIQAFFGYVETPSLNFLSRKITLECSDQRANRVIQLPPGVVSSIGTYSEAVFGRSKDASEELEKRLQTVASDFDFDSYGNYQLTPWLPKTIPDFTITSSEVRYIDNPSVAYTNRVKTINTINLTVRYTYQRLHQQAVNFNWPGYDDFLRDWWNNGKPSFPTKETISTCATTGDWKVVSPNGVNYVSIWPAQGFASGNGFIIWQPNVVDNVYKGRTKFAGYLKDSTGNFVTDGGTPAKLVPVYEPVLDANGKQIMDIVKTTIIDTSHNLCRGASWTSALRFAQSVTEEYTIKLYANQSIAKYGVIDSYEFVDLSDPYEVTKWENSGERALTIQNYYVNQKNNYSSLFQAIGVSLNKARHDILDLHRDVTVTFTTTPTPRPEIDLKHTVDVTINQAAIGSTASIHAKGKVAAVSHHIDFGTLEAFSEITLRLSRAQFSATSDVWSVPLPTEDPSYIGTPQTINLGTHIAINPDPAVTPGAEKWTGWICNGETTTQTNTIQRTTFTEGFIVDFPPIPDSLRNEITYYSDSGFNLAIPNDVLEISF